MTTRKPKTLDKILSDLQKDLYTSFGVPFDGMHKWPDPKLQLENDDPGPREFGEQVRSAVGSLGWALASQESIMRKARRGRVYPRSPLIKPRRSRPKTPTQ
jgi:hypothetical protein